MEPYPKRQRLYAPPSREFSQGFHNHYARYDDDIDELEGDDYEADIMEEEVEEDEQVDGEEDEEEGEGSYPEEQLQQKRAKLDFKLKSTFEAIFEKYGQNFDGVADEIDLETGEIVVNNGHLLEMHDERDAGDKRLALGTGEDDIEEQTDTEAIPSSPLEETEFLEVEDEEDSMSDDEEMMEDDMILRGFVRANRFVQASPELGASRVALPPRKAPRPAAVSRPSTQSNALPSRTEILAQFGPQLGPQIVNFVSKKQVPENSHVEPAWRAPELPKVASIKPTAIRRRTPEPEIERSPSPDAMKSIWAPVHKRSRRRPDGQDIVSIFQGESMAPVHHKSNAFDPSQRRSTDGLGLPVDSLPKPKKKYTHFTEKEDRVMLDWVSRGQARGQKLSALPMWQELAAKHPNHSASAWKSRYKRYYTYLPPSDHADGSESDTSVDTRILENGEFAKASAEAASHAARHPASERPSRIRKPAQRDSKIITWSDAVPTLQSLDPDLHAGMLEDTRMMQGHKKAFDYPGPSSYPGHNLSSNRIPIEQTRNAYTSSRISGTNFNDFDTGYDELGSMVVDASPSPEASTVREPCPHVECVPYKTILYRTQRLENEDLSEITSHLYRVHHMAPFPCGEVDCNRKGEEGYFMAAALVQHVKMLHPNAGAIQRLRGRVPDELLDRPTPSSPLNDRPIGPARDSDFMSPPKRYNPRVTFSSRPFSSSSDHDRTPRGTTDMLGASTSTPMTSVSSLKVHHSSATTVSMRDVSESQSLDSEEQIHDGILRSSWAGQIPREELKSADARRQRTPTTQQSLVQEPLLSRNYHDRNPLPTPTWESPRIEANKSLELNETKLVGTNELEATSKAEPSEVSIQSTSQSVAGSKPRTPQKIIQLSDSLHDVPMSSKVEPKTNIPAQRGSASQLFARNTVDPSYEFSDEEIGQNFVPEVLTSSTAGLKYNVPAKRGPKSFSHDTVDPTYQFSDQELGIESVTKQSHPTLKAIAQPAAHIPAIDYSAKDLATIIPPTTKPPTATTATRKSRKVQPTTVAPATETFANNQKALPQSVLDDDCDELSLNANDIVFLYSRPHTGAGPSSEVHVKEEETTVTPKTMCSLPTKNKKRKFSMFREGGDDEDELCVLGPSPEIKVEELDDAALLLVKSTKRAAKKRKISNGQPEDSSSKVKSSQSARFAKNLPIRTSTPLLDLTPSRSKTENKTQEVQDSAAEESSPIGHGSSPSHSRNRTRAQRGAAGTSSPLVGLLTPVRKKRLSQGDLLMEGEVPIVVKTPGGTFRNCGEDKFACGKPFCFRCGERA